MKSQYTFDIGRIEKSFTVDWNKYPEHVQEYFINYGLKKGFNDKLSGESLEAYRLIEGNGAKTQADFVDYTLGMIGAIHERMLAGEISAPRASSGGSLYGEVRAILRTHYSIKAKALAAIRNVTDLSVFCETRITQKLKDSGQKFVKQNVEYGAATMLDKILAAAQAALDVKADWEEPEINDMK